MNVTMPVEKHPENRCETKARKGITTGRKRERNEAMERKIKWKSCMLVKQGGRELNKLRATGCGRESKETNISMACRYSDERVAAKSVVRNQQ